jgi:hypothetical protein
MLGSVGVVRLDVYKDCSRAEKRQVLETFWRRGHPRPTERVATAARQYGPWAVLCLAILALELVPIIALSVAHTAVIILGAALVLEVLVLLSLMWAAIRWQELQVARA